MAKTLYDVWKFLPRGPRRRVRRWWFGFLSSVDSGSDFLLMNHGYAHLNPWANESPLAPEDAAQRFQIQLYHRIASAIDWRGREALEVSCGRGGGASYVARTFAPRSLVGLDITATAIRFCKRRYSLPGLSFRRGDAESLPFRDESFDVVLNVESSVTYENPQKFFFEAARVLRPGGSFLFADYREQQRIQKMRDQLLRTQLEMLKEEDITPNVALALDLDDERKRRLVEVYLPRFLQEPFLRFAGAKGGGDDDHRRFARGAKRYLFCVFRKR
jgi:ubiquinone/menaquinone biosynthesis C-methylase UbiE